MAKLIRISVLFIILGYVIWLSYAWLTINKVDELNIKEWQDGIAVAQKDGKYGYVNEKLKPVINYQYDIAEPFYGERAITGMKYGKEYKYSLIDKSGTYVGKFYDEMNHLGNNLYRVRTNIAGKKSGDDGYYAWYLMDSNGNLLSQKSYTLIDNFYDGFARACIKRDCKFIDTNGKEALRLGKASNENRVVHSYDFSNGKLDTSTGREQGFSQGLLKNDKNGLIGFINGKGEVVIKHQFTQAKNFSNNLAVVTTKDGIGVIDLTGNFIVKPSKDYNDIQPFNHDVAIFNQGGYQGVMDNMGKIIVPTSRQYHTIRPFNIAKVATIQKDELFGVIDNTGKEIIPPIYSEIWGDFEYGYARVSTPDDPNHIWHVDKNNQIIGYEKLITSP